MAVIPASLRSPRTVSCLRRRTWSAAIVALALASGGCWEEIRYQASPEADAVSPTQSPAEVVQKPLSDGATSDAQVVEPSVVDAALQPALTPEPAADPFYPPSPPPAVQSSTAGAATTPDADPFVAAPPPGSDAAAPSPSLPPPTPPAQPPTPHERLLAWRAASKWSLAAAAYGKGLDASRYEPLRQVAAEAAAELHVELPPLPFDERRDLEAAVVESLDAGPGAALPDVLGKRTDPQAAAAARLAVRSHLLLLVYSPLEAEVPQHVALLRQASEASGLPAEFWEPLIKLVEARAEFLAVRSAVFELHRRVEEHLGGL